MNAELKKQLRRHAADSASRGIESALAIRASGFNSSSVYDDWMMEQCSAAMWEEQLIYQREYSAEALLTELVSDIVLNDQYVPHSPWLREKKAERLKRFGPVDALASDAPKSHLVELTACLRMLARTRQRIDDECLADYKRISAEYDRRRSKELDIHRESIRNAVRTIPTQVTDKSISAWALDAIVATHWPLAGSVLEIDSSWGPTPAIHWPFGFNATLAFLPCFGLSGGRAHRTNLSGRVGFVFQLTMLDDLDKPFDRSRDTQLQLETQFPGEMEGYTHFISKWELALNIIAWAELLRWFLPQLITSLSRRQ